MISEERLKELKEQNKIVFSRYGTPFNLKDYEISKTHIIRMTNENCFYAEYSFDYLYETKEEAEFVAKYHCSKTIRFEPPTFEEFMKYVEFGITPFHLSESIEIDINEDWKMFYVITAYTPAKNFEYIEYKDKRNAYYQAVEYAKKLFLGEEE